MSSLVLTCGKNGTWAKAKPGDQQYLYVVEYAKSGRARCRKCSNNIEKATPRIGIPVRHSCGEFGFISTWQHVKCVRVDETREELEGKIQGYDTLKKEDAEAMLVEITRKDHPEHLKALDPEDMIKRGPLPRTPTPDDVLQHLLPYQQEGVGWMCDQEGGTYRGGILADEMGMGKTIQTLSMMVLRKGNGPTLVVCPTSSMLQWQQEIKDNLREGALSVVVYDRKVKKGQMEAADVVLCTYAVMEQMWRKVVDSGKVACEYCGKLFLPRKLRVHNKYYCGPEAKKTAKQMKQEKAKQSGKTIKKGLKTLHVDVEGLEVEDEGDSSNNRKRTRTDTKSSVPTPMALYRDLMNEAGRRVKSRWEKKMQEGGSDSCSEDEEEEDDDDDDKAEERKTTKKGSSTPKGKAAAKKSQKSGALKKEDADEDTKQKKGTTKITVKDKKKTAVKKRTAGAAKAANGKKGATSRKRGRAAESDDESSEEDEDSDSDSEDDTSETSSDSASEDDDSDEPSRKRATSGSTEAAKSRTVHPRCSECNYVIRRHKYCPKDGKLHVIPGKEEADAKQGKSVNELSIAELPGMEIDPHEEDVGEDAVDLSKSPLHSIEWHRIVLDEAHRIKSRTTSTTKAAFALRATHKWCLTGTPLQNRVGDLYSLLRFIRMPPFARYYCQTKGCRCTTLGHPFSRDQLRACMRCGHGPLQHFSYFNKHIMNPILRYGYVGDGRRSLLTLKNEVLDKLMLRRTKQERAEEVRLPPCVVELRKLAITDEERDFYESIYKTSSAKFNTFVAKGTLLNNYAHIFELLSRLRQALDHPYLVVHHKSFASALGKTQEGAESESGAAAITPEVVPSMAAPQMTDVCGMCQDDVLPVESCVVEPCLHSFHKECFAMYVLSAPSDNVTCPKCFAPVTFDARKLRKVTEAREDHIAHNEEPDEDEDIAPALPPGMEEGSPENAGSSPTRQSARRGRNSVLQRIDTSKFVYSTKLRAVVDYAKNDIPVGEKGIIFSQFGTMLDIIEYALEKEKVRTVKLIGSMPMVMRQSMLHAFKTDDSVKIILVSLRAGGEGLNLQNANHVLLVDPWWNPAVEMQAVQRAHRIGQQRPVKAIRFATADTIEDRMTELTDKKQLVFEGTIDSKVSSLHRLSEEDLQFLFTR